MTSSPRAYPTSLTDSTRWVFSASLAVWLSHERSVLANEVDCASRKFGEVWAQRHRKAAWTEFGRSGGSAEVAGGLKRRVWRCSRLVVQASRAKGSMTYKETILT